jgi:hypothetical protein
MDEQVKKALAKWPNVPHCYGWLALDARGDWRMRDEAAQRKNSPGDRIAQPGLRAFINRNYAGDESGCRYFQNGPQRVYVEIDAAPYVVTIAHDGGLRLHTGETWRGPDAAWLSDHGRVWLQCATQIALLDDRDLALLLPMLSLARQPLTDDALAAWLQGEGAKGTLQLRWEGRTIAVDYLAEDAAPQHFGFVRSPLAQRASRVDDNAR